MKARTQGFKEQIKIAGREIEVKVSYDDVVLDSETINIFKPHFNTELFKTIMKTFEFDSNVKVPAKTWVKAEFGIKVDGEYEYLDFGQYYINDEPEYSADNRAYTHKAYDAMIEAMIPFDENPLYIEYPISYDDLITNIINQLGWTYDLPADYPNKDTMIEYDLYSNLGLTYRDILDDLCPATMGNFIVSDNREFKLIYPTETGDTIDEEYLKDANVNVSKKVGPVNALVLSRAEEGDTINRTDEDSIELNGLNEIKIKDNLLLSSAFREDFIDEMFEQIKGFEYYSIDVASTGVGYYEPLDRFTMSIEGENYSVVLLNSELNVEGGISENLFTPELDEAVTDYSTSGLSDKGQKFANIIAYKNQAKIEMIAGQIDDLTDFIKSITNQGDLIELPNTPKSNGAIRELRIKNFQLMELYPGMSYPSGFVYPGVLNFYMLIFDNIDTFNNNPHYVYINSPIPLQSVISEGQTYHNELVIEENKVKIIENIKWNFETEEYEVVPIPTIHELTTVVLPTFEVDTYIKVDYFTDLIFDAEYLIKNDFTDTFTTQTESSSQFTINSEEIATKVSKDNIISEINQSPEAIKINANKIILEGNEEFSSIISGINNQLEDIQDQIDGKVSTYYGTDAPTLYNYPADEWITEEDRNNHLGDLYYDGDGKAYRFSYIDDEYVWKEIADSDIQAVYDELNSKIIQTKGELQTEVSGKVGNTEIISRINQTPETASINANRISLAGKIIDLTSDNIVIDSTNFKVDKYGKITATGANISGTINATSGSFSGTINAGSGNIGGWNINDVSINKVGKGMHSGSYPTDPAIWVGEVYPWGTPGWTTKTPFYVTNAGLLVAKNADIQGKITATSGSIGGTTMSGNTISGGSISITKGNYFFNMGVSTSNPNVSGLNVGNYGINFRGWKGINMTDSQTFDFSSANLNAVNQVIRTSPGNLNLVRSGGRSINIGQTQIIIGNITVGDDTEGRQWLQSGTTGKSRITLGNALYITGGNSGSNWVYCNGGGSGNSKIRTEIGLSSSLNIKENIKKFTKNRYDEALDLLNKIDIYDYDYKYKKHQNKNQYGFIIDYVEESDENNFFNFTEEKGQIENGVYNTMEEEDLDKTKEQITIKKYDADVLDKYLLTCIKALQLKINRLEEQYGKTN